VKNIHKLLFTIILVLAIFFRFWHLGTLPVSLNWDEISHGYTAYSLLKTGKDQWGVSWPIFNFRAYGDYPTTFDTYLTIPFIKFFGLNALSIRLPSAIFGIIFVVLIFFFAQTIFKNNHLALFCMFLAAVSPWSLFPSRAVFQSNFSQVLFLAGFYFFLRGLKHPKSFIFSSLFFGISLYSYHNARIAVPLLIPLLIFFYRRDFRKIFSKNKASLFLSLLIFLILAIPNLLNLFSPQSAARNRWVGIINPNSINLINEKRRLFTGPQFLNVLLNNKPLYFTQTLFVNYLDLLNPLPLFFQGSQDYQFNPPNTGLIFIIFLPFFYIGLIKAITPSKKHFIYSKLLIIFLISLLPAALTVGDFPSIRATIALPFYFIFIALGLSQLNFSKFKIIYCLVILVSLLEFANYWQNYLVYCRNYSSAWQYGYQQAVDIARQNYSQYDHIYFTKKYGEPHEFILFFWPWNPGYYQTDPTLKWDFHADWYWVNSFDKFIFVNDWEIKDLKIPAHSLLITSPSNYPAAKATLKNTINFLDNTSAFDIVSYD
jgi:4-amino-4-deoxy-L-arabinose transferase-like glycosyltransferase